MNILHTYQPLDLMYHSTILLVCLIVAVPTDATDWFLTLSTSKLESQHLLCFTLAQSSDCEVSRLVVDAMVIDQ